MLAERLGMFHFIFKREIILLQHDLKMTVNQVRAAVDLIDLRLIGNDPDLIEHIHGDVRTAKFFFDLLLDSVPERAAGRAFRIHDGGRYLL